MDVEETEGFSFATKHGMRVWEERHLFVDKFFQDNKITRVCQIFLFLHYFFRELFLLKFSKICDLGCNRGKFLKRLSRNEDYECLVREASSCRPFISPNPT